MSKQRALMKQREALTRRQALRQLGGCAVAAAAFPLLQTLDGQALPQVEQAVREAGLGGSVAAPLLLLHNRKDGSSGKSPRPVTLDGKTGQRLQKLFDNLTARPDVHQAILVVESGDGQARWSRTAGIPGSEMDTGYFAASIAKVYTATVVLRLAEQRRIGLDQPIAMYLPEHLIRRLHRLDGIDHTAAITVRHLLSHTSGLADYFTDRPKDGRSLSERIIAEGDQAWNLDELAERVRSELVAHFPPQPAGATRQKVRYSDTNYQLLGAIIEAVTARPLHRVFEEEIFRPLGLENTYLFPQRPAGIPLPAPIWIGNETRELPLALASFGADGGIVSTATDSILFLRALLRGQLFDDPDTVSLLHARWNRFRLPLDAVALQLPSWPVEYGLGMMRFRLPAMLNRFRSMPELLGHTGSTGSWLFHCPDLDVTIAGTVNQATAGALPYRFLPRVLRALA